MEDIEVSKVNGEIELTVVDVLDDIEIGENEGRSDLVKVGSTKVDFEFSELYVELDSEVDSEVKVDFEVDFEVDVDSEVDFEVAKVSKLIIVGGNEEGT